MIISCSKCGSYYTVAEDTVWQKCTCGRVIWVMGAWVKRFLGINAQIANIAGRS